MFLSLLVSRLIGSLFAAEPHLLKRSEAGALMKVWEDQMFAAPLSLCAVLTFKSKPNNRRSFQNRESDIFYSVLYLLFTWQREIIKNKNEELFSRFFSLFFCPSFYNQHLSYRFQFPFCSFLFQFLFSSKWITQNFPQLRDSDVSSDCFLELNMFERRAERLEKQQ